MKTAPKAFNTVLFTSIMAGLMSIVAALNAGILIVFVGSFCGYFLAAIDCVISLVNWQVMVKQIEIIRHGD